VSDEPPAWKQQYRNEVLAAYVAGFRASSEGNNGEYTGPSRPDPWDDDFGESGFIRDDFERWVQGREIPAELVPDDE